MSEPGAGGARLDPAMRAALGGVVAAGAVMVVLVSAFVDARAGLGVAVGGVIAAVNLLVFARIGQAFLAQKGAAAPWAVIAVLKLALLFGGVWLLLKSGLVSGVWLAVGYGALPLGITVGTLFAPKPSDTDEPATRSAPPAGDVIEGGRRSPSDPPARGS